MRKTLLIALVMLMSGTLLLAYEPGAFNLKTPMALERGQGEFRIQHRFRGKVNDEPFGSFLGMDLAGANVGIGLRCTVWSRLELNCSRIWDGKEYTTGLSYAYSLPMSPLYGQVDAQFFSYESEERRSGFLGLLSLLSEPAFGRITPVANIGYNTDNRKFGAGLGFAVVVIEDLGIVRRVNIIAEYFPTVSETGNKNCFDFGFGLETYGHHFDFILSNNSQIGVRRLMSGTMEASGLRFGFNIKRSLGS